MNNFFTAGIVLLVVGSLLNALTTLVVLGGILVTLGWVGLITGGVILLFSILNI